jgi:hypothetical protein
MVFTIEFLFVLRALISSIPRTANSLGSFYPGILKSKILSKILSENVSVFVAAALKDRTV